MDGPPCGAGPAEKHKSRGRRPEEPRKSHRGAALRTPGGRCQPLMVVYASGMTGNGAAARTAGCSQTPSLRALVIGVPEPHQSGEIPLPAWQAPPLLPVAGGRGTRCPRQGLFVRPSHGVRRGWGCPARWRGGSGRPWPRPALLPLTAVPSRGPAKARQPCHLSPCRAVVGLVRGRAEAGRVDSGLASLDWAREGKGSTFSPGFMAGGARTAISPGTVCPAGCLASPPAVLRLQRSLAPSQASECGHLQADARGVPIPAVLPQEACSLCPRAPGRLCRSLRQGRL